MQVSNNSSYKLFKFQLIQVTNYLYLSKINAVLSVFKSILKLLYLMMLITILFHVFACYIFLS